MFISESQIRVRYAETDQMGVVYHGNYAQYFETARAESIRKLGFTYKDMEAAGIMMPVVELHTKFLRPALYDELLTVKVILKELPPHHRIEFHHEVYSENNELITVGRIVLYFIETKTMKKTSMPGQLLEKLRPYFNYDDHAR
ncbi:MAG TPA: thioesterase family protein [Puia sp.]|nr:thioesterase family protein [Puia sp.]